MLFVMKAGPTRDLHLVKQKLTPLALAAKRTLFLSQVVLQLCLSDLVKFSTALTLSPQVHLATGRGLKLVIHLLFLTSEELTPLQCLVHSELPLLPLQTNLPLLISIVEQQALSLNSRY